ncbi:MAG: hypothetical protein AAGA85_09950 [Bacteroidota bacterium]
MKSFILYCTAIFLTTMTFAQGMVDPKPVEENRYEGKEQDPYLFQDFAKAVATKFKTGETEEYLLNYNGYTNAFEIMHDGKLCEMNATYFDVIEVAEYTPSKSYSDKFVSPSLKFVKGVNASAPRKFSVVIVEDESATLYKDFAVKISTREMNDPIRGVVERESFSPSFHYYIKLGDETKPIGLGKQKVVNQLADDKVSSYMKKNKLKIKTEKELVQVVAYYAGLQGAAPLASASSK